MTHHAWIDILSWGIWARTILGKISSLGERASRAITTALVFAILTGCQDDVGEKLQSGRVLAWEGLQGRWAGDIVPTQSSCGTQSHGLMSVGPKTFGFDPFEGTAVIQGVVTADGRLIGTLQRQGGDHQNLSLAFEASASQPVSAATTINGKLASGRCQWTVTLHRG